MIVGWCDALTAEVNPAAIPGAIYADVYRWKSGKRCERLYHEMHCTGRYARKAVKDAKRALADLAPHDCTEMHELLRLANVELDASLS